MTMQSSTVLLALGRERQNELLEEAREARWRRRPLSPGTGESTAVRLAPLAPGPPRDTPVSIEHRAGKPVRQVMVAPPGEPHRR